MAEILLHPGIPLIVGALIAWWGPTTVRQIALIGAPIAALGLLTLLEPNATLAATLFGYELTPLRADRLAMAFGWIFAIVGMIAGIYGLRVIARREVTAALAYAGAAMGVVYAGDLLTLFIFWEIKAVASTFVILSRRADTARRAGLRYLFVHLVGGKLLLAGVVWHYSTTGSLAFDAFALSAATSLILVAFLLSAAAPPLHAWLTDAYPQASVVGTVFLSAYTTKSAVYALARGFPGTELLVWLGVAMALYGVVLALVQNDMRRLLSYHIVSQVGYMIAAIGVGTQMAINGATAHAFAHILYKGLLLMGTGAVIHATGKAKMSELGGLFPRMKTVFVLYMIGAVSISSMPLFSGFVSKELAVYAAGVDERALVVFLLKVVSVGTFLCAGLKLPYATWFGGTKHDVAAEPSRSLPLAVVPLSMIVAMSLSATLNFAIGVYPTLLYDLMPYAVDYDAYTLAKVVEKTQILLFTTLGFWLIHEKLRPEAAIIVDTDVVYRRVLAPVRRVFVPQQETAEERPARSAAITTRLFTARTAIERWLPAVRGSEPPVYPTWTLGAVFLAVALILLLLTLRLP